MYELVEVRKDEIFTNSKVIAEGTGNKHHAVQQLISKYEKIISRFGQVAFEMRAVKYSRGTNEEKVYLLNEEQAAFVMTLMRNDGEGGVVIEFKARLIEEFYKMRRFLIEKQSKSWIETRKNNKESRLKETDVIKLLVSYAKNQGSTNADRLYVVYTKLANTVINGRRDDVGVMQLNNLTLVENIILQTIRIDMSLEMYYKDIYKDCRNRIEQFLQITYLVGQNQ